MFTVGQKLWLETRGGRTERDLVYIGAKPYVVMWDGETRQEYNLPVPEEKEVLMERRQSKHGDWRIYHL